MGFHCLRRTSLCLDTARRAPLLLASSTATSYCMEGALSLQCVGSVLCASRVPPPLEVTTGFVPYLHPFCHVVADRWCGDLCTRPWALCPVGCLGTSLLRYCHCMIAPAGFVCQSCVHCRVYAFPREVRMWTHATTNLTRAFAKAPVYATSRCHRHTATYCRTASLFLEACPCERHQLYKEHRPLAITTAFTPHKCVHNL